MVYYNSTDPDFSPNSSDDTDSADDDVTEDVDEEENPKKSRPSFPLMRKKRPLDQTGEQTASNTFGQPPVKFKKAGT